MRKGNKDTQWEGREKREEEERERGTRESSLAGVERRYRHGGHKSVGATGIRTR